MVVELDIYTPESFSDFSKGLSFLKCKMRRRGGLALWCVGHILVSPSFIHSFTGSFSVYYISGTVTDWQDLRIPTDSRETKNEELDKVTSGRAKL